MATVKRPVESGSASGSIGKDLVYAKWRGIPYVRSHVIPANPRTVEQVKTRSVFTWLNAFAKAVPPPFWETWKERTRGEGLTYRNAFLGQNVRVLRTATNLQAFIASSGAAGGAPPASVTASSPGPGQATIRVTQQELPTGWTIKQAYMLLVSNQDPHQAFTAVVRLALDPTAPYEQTFSNLPAGNYLAAGRFEYGRPASQRLARHSTQQ